MVVVVGAREDVAVAVVDKHFQQWKHRVPLAARMQDVQVEQMWANLGRQPEISIQEANESIVVGLVYDSLGPKARLLGVRFRGRYTRDQAESVIARLPSFVKRANSSPFHGATPGRGAKHPYRRLDNTFLAEVAKSYAEIRASGSSALLFELSERYSVVESTACRWVRKARDAGLIR